MHRITRIAAAVGIAGLAAFGLAACDEADVSPSGTSWVFTPDVALHRQTGNPLVRFQGLCANSQYTWWVTSQEIDADTWQQGRTVVVPCGGGPNGVQGHATGGGNWGTIERPK